MRDITFQSLHGQDEIAIAGIVFANGETKEFGTGADDLTDDLAELILTNPNFIDAELGRNPNYTCACGKPLVAFALDPAVGRVRTEATECGHCDEAEAPPPEPEPVLAPANQSYGRALADLNPSEPEQPTAPDPAPNA